MASTEAVPPSSVHAAAEELTASFNVLMRAHKEMSSSGEPMTGTEWKQVGLIESLLSTIVRQMMAYDGTRSLATQAINHQSQSDVECQVNPSDFHRERARSLPNAYGPVDIFERTIAWEKKRLERLEAYRQKKLEEELAPQQARRRPSQWDHVESVMRRQRLQEEEEARMAAEALRRQEEEEARARAAAESEIIARAKADDAAIEAEIRRRVEEEQRRKEEEVRKKREAKERAEAEKRRQEQEVVNAFGTSGLERRPSMPNKFVWRVTSPAGLTGNVMHEYRIKDTVTKTKGISFVMGQTHDAGDDIVQAILFDKDKFDEYQAAVWWNDNQHHFAAHQRKAEAAALAARNAFAQGKSAKQALAAAGRAVMHNNQMARIEETRANTSVAPG